MTELPRSVSDPVRVLLIEDQDMIREGIRLLIENHHGMTVVGEAKCRSGALDAVACQQPDVILLDLDLGDDHGLNLLPELLAISQGMRALILTGLCNFDLHLNAVRRGAMGLVLKSEAAETLIQAIHKVHAGEVWLNGKMMTCLLNDLWQARANHLTEGAAAQAKFPENSREATDVRWPGGPADEEAAKIATLTAREREIVTLIGEGMRNQRIAERLYICSTTVRHHLSAIFDKLGVADRFELAIYAYRHGLAKIPR